jgi:hypothetical protein
MKQKSKRSNKLITVQGILLPVDWNKDGHVIALGLSGIDEKEYRIEAKTKKADLFAHLQKKVEVKGWLREHAGNRVIVLKNYRII